MLPVLKFIMVFQKKNQLLRREKSPSMLLTNGDHSQRSGSEGGGEVFLSADAGRGSSAGNTTTTSATTAALSWPSSTSSQRALPTSYSTPRTKASPA